MKFFKSYWHWRKGHILNKAYSPCKCGQYSPKTSSVFGCTPVDVCKNCGRHEPQRRHL